MTPAAKLAHLYATHGKGLRAYLEGRNLHHDVDDRMQDTLIRVWRNADRLEPDRARGYLFAAARSVTIDAIRARGSRVLTTELDEDVSGVPDATLRVVDRDTVAWVLAQLRPVHRDVLVHRHLYDHTVAETAAALGIPQGTAKSREHYGLRVARRLLDQGGTS